jgi:hypothetical protein
MLSVLYISSRIAISHGHDHDFVHVKVGDTEPLVIAAMGSPSDEERAGAGGANGLHNLALTPNANSGVHTVEYAA